MPTVVASTDTPTVPGLTRQQAALTVAVIALLLLDLTAVACMTQVVAGEPRMECGIRSVGGILQIGGLFVAAAGITAARRRWAPEQRGVLGRIGRLVDRVLGRRQHVTGAGASIGVAVTSSGAGTVTPLASSKRTLEQRVSALEARAEQSDKRAHAIEQGLVKEARERKAADKQESAAREAAVGRLDKAVVELATGDLREEALGVFLFVVGVVLATWSEQIAWLLAG